MLKFFATGQHFKEKKTPTRFLPQRGVKDQASLLHERNYVDGGQQINMKQAATRKHSNQTYKEGYSLRNTGNSQDRKYYRSQYSSMSQKKPSSNSTSQPALGKLEDEGVKTERSLFLKDNSNHFHDWKLTKERQFAFQSHNQNSGCAQSQVIKKEDYYNLRKQSQSSQSQEKLIKRSVSSEKSFLPRENFYRTKPLLRLDNDFKDKPLIKNVQTISEDTPQWCQSTNKYYDPQLVDATKKQRKQKLPNADLFGNPVKKYENNFMFDYRVPFQGQIHDRKKVVIVDKEELQLAKTQTKKEMQRGHANLTWKEQPAKQRYEYTMPSKILANPQQPYIKTLENKRNNVDPYTSKIGTENRISLNNKDKFVQLKIGHGKAETINPVKYQPMTTHNRIF